MAFGVLYDFKGNTNKTKVIKAATLVNETWFQQAISFNEPIDLFIVLGHNPVRPTDSESTFGIIYNAIRAKNPNTPIQFLGGHSHVRDFVVFDEGSTGIESGRYCETLGWMSMSGINSSSYRGVMQPRGVPNPTQKALKVTKANGLSPALSTATATSSVFSDMVYSRRYLDWNRLSFEYHAVGSQASTFDYHSGLRVTSDIANLRKQLNLTTLYGCAPQTYCQNCAPFGSPGNIFPLVQTALAATVVNSHKSKRPFTYDDAFIVSPFTDGFHKRRRDLETKEFRFSALTGDGCVADVYGPLEGKPGLARRSAPLTRGKHRRQTSTLTPGYTTTDDFGTNGDDTPHTPIPHYAQPSYVQTNASFPASGTTPPRVDLIFLDYFADSVVAILNGLGENVTTAQVQYYLDPKVFTTQSYLPAYAKLAWQKNVPSCPIAVVGQVT